MRRTLRGILLATTVAGALAVGTVPDVSAQAWGTGRGLRSELRAAANDLVHAATGLRSAVENRSRRGEYRDAAAIRALRVLEGRTADLLSAADARLASDELDRAYAAVSDARAIVLDRMQEIGHDAASQERLGDFEGAFAAFRTAHVDALEARRDRDRERGGERGERGERGNWGDRANWGDRGDRGERGMPAPDRGVRIPAGTRLVVRTDREMCANALPRTGAGDLRFHLASDIVVNGRVVARAGADAGVTPATRTPQELSLVLTAVRVGPEFVKFATRPITFRAQGNRVVSENPRGLEPSKKGRTPFRNRGAVCLGDNHHVEFEVLEDAMVPAEWME